MPAQAPSQLSDRRPDGILADIWLPNEGCTTSVVWVAEDAAPTVQQDAAAAATDDGGLESVLAAVCQHDASSVRMAGQGNNENPVLWAAEEALQMSQLRRAPAKIKVPAQEPITLPPWGSRAAARPAAQQPLGEAALKIYAAPSQHSYISNGWIFTHAHALPPCGSLLSYATAHTANRDDHSSSISQGRSMTARLQGPGRR